MHNKKEEAIHFIFSAVVHMHLAAADISGQL